MQTPFSNAYGMSAVGMLISWMCFGGTTAQVSYYFQNYPKDKMRVKLFVLLLFALDIVKEANTCNALWYRVVTHRGDVFIAEIWTSSDYIVWVFSALAIVCVQWFYIWNFWILSRRTWLRIALTAIAITLTVIALVATFVVVYETNLAQTSTAGNEASIAAHILVPSRLQSVTELAANVYISLSLAYILHGAKSGFRTTDNLIGRLITFVVNRGILLFILQLLEVVLYNADGQFEDTTSAMFYFPSSTIHINTVLIVLNERRRIKDDDDSDHSAPLSEFQAAAIVVASRTGPVDPEDVQKRTSTEGVTHAMHEASH